MLQEHQGMSVLKNESITVGIKYSSKNVGKRLGPRFCGRQVGCRGQRRLPENWWHRLRG